MSESREVALAREIMRLEEQSKDLAALVKANNGYLEARENELMELLAQEGKTSTGHIEGIGIFALRRENYPNVSQERMPQFLAYLRKKGDGGIIVETVPAQTLKKYLKDKIEELTEKFVEEPEAAERAEQQLGLTESVAPAELAKLYMEQYGAKTFQKISLSHTKRGR